MFAAAYDTNGSPDVLKYVELPDPTVRRGGVIIHVEAIGIQGGDTLNRARGELVTHPHVVGYQASGTIIECGEGVTDRKLGDRVVATMANGSHASIVSVPAGATWLIPDSMTFDTAAGIPIEFGTADDCLFEFGRLQAGETVLIQAGAGGVGLAAIQLAKAAGATVIATASGDERVARLGQYGMDCGINYAIKDVAAEVRQITNGKGVDLVVDPVGGAVLESSIACLAYRGRISWVGQAGRDAEVPAVWPLMEKNASLTGVFLGIELVINPIRAHALIARLIERIGAGELTVVVDSVFPLQEAAEAHRHIESRQAFGRVILKP